MKRKVRADALRPVRTFLRDEMERRGMKMIDVARRSGLSHVAVLYALRGDRNSRADTLERIAEAIGTELRLAAGPTRRKFVRTIRPAPRG